MRSSRLLAGACALVVMVALLPGSATATGTQAATDQCTVDTPGPQVAATDVSPSRVVIASNDAPVGFLYNVNFYAKACTIGSVEVGLDVPGGMPLSSPDFWLAYMGTSGTVESSVEDWNLTQYIEPLRLADANAGEWTSILLVDDRGGHDVRTTGPSFSVVRAAKITNNASPEPVGKGGTITIAGALTRVSWDDWAYHGYAGRPVELQFRTLSGSYSMVKTITTSSTGALKTTVQASEDGCFRFVFKGSPTTAPVTGVGDCVDVQ